MGGPDRAGVGLRGGRGHGDPATLASGADDALYVRTPDGDRARLTRTAQLSLADHLREDAGAFWLELAGTTTTTSTTPSTSPQM